MKINITEEKQNSALKRKELIAEIEYDGPTSSKAELQKMLSETLNVDIKKIEIKKILSHIGKAGGRLWANIWEEKEVPIYAELKKPKEAKPKEEKREEAPKEKSKEEAKPVKEKPPEPKPEKVEEKKEKAEAKPEKDGAKE